MKGIITKIKTGCYKAQIDDKKKNQMRALMKNLIDMKTKTKGKEHIIHS